MTEREKFYVVKALFDKAIEDRDEAQELADKLITQLQELRLVLASKGDFV